MSVAKIKKLLKIKINKNEYNFGEIICCIMQIYLSDHKQPFAKYMSKAI